MDCRKLLPIVFLGLVTSLCVTTVEAAIFIDSFDNTIQQLQNPSITFPSSGTIATADALGGFRTASVLRDSGTGRVSLDSNFTNGGALSYASPLATGGTATVLWDANGAGLGGVSGFDLTQGGLNSIFFLSFSSDLGASLTLTLNSVGGGISTASLAIPISPSAFVQGFIPFSGFVGSVNFTKISSINLFIDGRANPAVDVAIDYLLVDSPEPGTLSMLAGAFLGLAIWRGKFRNKPSSGVSLT